MKSVLTKSDFISSYKLTKFADRSIAKYNIKFPIYGNNNLTQIISFLTFDGHLYLSGKAFLFASKLMPELKKIEKLVHQEFGLTGKYRKIKSNYGECNEYRIISAPISRILELLGTPKGSKVKQEFSVPNWIKKNTEFSRIYLKTAFDCEGSVWEEPNRLRIRFRINKIEEKLDNGIRFMEELKKMLNKFNVETTEIWITDSNLRKDGHKTKGMIFDIKASSLKTYREQIGFNIINKRNRLESWGH